MKAAYLNAKNYDEMDLLKTYLKQVISSFRVKDTKVNNKNEKKKPYKIPKVDRSNPKASGSKPYEQKPKSGANKWKETLKMARVLMEVKDAIEE
ncbi:hypothetical protein PTTG_11034 [Puccinia triticina 1-1 BBBD Race 1]|uniref:Uncharacterized protein n=1 Tax=Puccinia triticina (isolate 1-1 / race 1 (BBBD)) TaxID=630390 RepID=A0A0C4FCT0_PUCT1|nr:hypothetical protein PTTG_11034 [Puccinia triticina 1-1 BBBD Race 1]